jgi:O-antigen/teichoic acid export membrane protein
MAKLIETLRNKLQNEMIQKYLKNISWLFIEKIFRIISGLFVGIWVARYLGPKDFGMFSYAMSFVGLFITVGSLGVDSILVRELVKTPEKRHTLLGTSFLMKLIGAFFVFCILFIFLSVSPNEQPINLMIWIIGGTVFFQALNVIEFYFQSIVKSKYVVFANLIALSISAGLKIIFILTYQSVIYFAGVFLLESIVFGFGLVYFYQNQKLNFKNWEIDVVVAKSILKDSWPLILTGVVISVYMKIDQVMIKHLIGDTAVGEYAVAVKLSELWYFIPIVIVSSVYPALIEAKKNSEEFFKSRLQKLYDLMVWMAIFIAVPMTFLSDFVVTLLYGNAYESAGGVLMIHIWTGIFVFMGLAFSNYLTIENLTKKSLYRTTLGAVVNVILNFILIPKLGIKGGAVATLIAQITTNYLYDLFDKDLRSQFVMKSKSFFPVHYLIK